MCVCLLERTFRDGFTEKVMFEQRPAGGEGVALADSWGKSIPSRGNSQGPGLGALWRGCMGMVGYKGGRNSFYLEGPGSAP